MCALNFPLIYTNENCVGCNKCLSVCNTIGACVASLPDDSGKYRVTVDPAKCIACGECVKACEHDARKYSDDTENFFNDLKRGEKISVLLAPAFKANYPDEYAKVLGGLKELGVEHLISVSFGADITTWGYINYINKYGFKGGISQPCPVVVNYIEKYQPQLIKKLFPIQSPLMCAAIYAKKQMGVTDKLAFISPCIAKKIEIEDPCNKGYVSYNVTFGHLMDYIRKNNLFGKPCEDEIEYGLGAVYPMPGGLMENVRWLCGEKEFIRSLSGKKRLYDFIRDNAKNISEEKTPFLLIDALNCENGCLCGTATDSEISETDTALYNLISIQNKVIKNDGDSVWSACSSPKERLELLNRQFANLDLNDYIRTYTDKSEGCSVKEPSEEDYENIFTQMKKNTPASRAVNCTSCGYDNCREMAKAIFNGFNHKENCVYYLKESLEEDHLKLKYRSEHDSLLDIMNRRAAAKLLNKKFTAESKFSVIIADIDGFKSLNETYGYEQTDLILKYLGKKLKFFSVSNDLIIARQGGDEFLFAAADVQLDEKHELIENLVSIFSEPIPLGEEKIKLSACFGISNSDGITEPDQHIINAENAMFEAKSHKRNSVFVYSEELKKQALEEAEIKEKLLEAFENDGFYMVYQPQINSKTKQTSGYEALVRMKAPGLYPGQFIPVAEKNGWIWRIGRITTELAIRQLAQWRDAKHALHPVSINFSSNQLSDTGYIDFLENLLEKYNIPPKYVEIEITEGVFLSKNKQADELFKRFKQLGIRLLMDDFGTGYSSLAYLTYIPVDVVKLDKSLVDTYLVDGKDSFIKHIIQLVHDLDKEMLIEGVEENWQYERLCEFNADTIQGYYFSKPIPAEEAIVFNASKIGA
ncbi:MAG: EAL domain-containing protein [Treponema sp.]|nr:EAL domain-containing protein [Treponema sp.]